MIDLLQDKKLFDAGPLLELKIAKYRLSFSSSVMIKAHVLSALLRSRLGYILKGRFCPFQDYRVTPCDTCTISSHCFYPALFAPKHENIEKDNLGGGRPQATPPRPFSLDVPVLGKDKTLMPGEKGEVELTLFGSRAISFQRPMLESVIHALGSIHKSRLEIVSGRTDADEHPLKPLSWQGLVPEFKHGEWGFVRKDEAWIVKENMENTLKDWIRAMPQLRLDEDSNGVSLLNLDLRTPFQLERVGKKLTFICFLQSIVSRLRDLKRNYHVDNGMGDFPECFHGAAGRIRTFSDIEKVRHRWYSYRQKRDMDLGGLTGSLIFKGDIKPFMPLIAAGFFIGVGKKVAYGLGRFDMAQCDVWQSKKS